MADNPLTFRLNYKQRAALAAAAKDLGTSKSALIRSLLADSLEALVEQGLVREKAMPLP